MGTHTLKATTKTHYVVIDHKGNEQRLPRRLRMTKAAVHALPLMADDSQPMFGDTELPGLWLRVGKTKKSYFVQATLDGVSKQRTIGDSRIFTAEQARQEAREIQVKMTKGIDPLTEKRQRREQRAEEQKRRVTLREALDAYCSRPLKPRTRKDYRESIDCHLSDWLDKPLIEITRTMVSKRHAKIKAAILAKWAKTGKKWSMAGCGADAVLQLLGSIWNFATEQYEFELPTNPTTHLKRTKQYSPTRRRETFIDEPELPAWFGALDSVRSDQKAPPTREIACDYLEVLILTGLRRNEAATLKWDQVDWQRKFITVKETKNGKPHVLPLTNRLLRILEGRRDDPAMVLLDRTEPWVFPSLRIKGPLIGPENIMQLVSRQSGVEFGCHDLRRTFITSAVRCGVSDLYWKRLLNHSCSDVTAGYIVTKVEDLRPAMETISEYFLGMRAKQQGLRLAAS